MKIACLLSTVLFVTAVSAHRSLLAGSNDKYNIATSLVAGNATGAVNGFAKAGQSADSAAIVAALVQVFSNSKAVAYSRVCFFCRLGRDTAADRVHVVFVLNQEPSGHVDLVIGVYFVALTEPAS